MTAAQVGMSSPQGSAAPVHQTKTEPPPAQVAGHVAPAPATATDADLETLWVRLVESVGRVSPFTRSYLLEAHPVSFVKNVLTIGFDPQFEDHIGLVDNARNHTLIQTKLSELGHPNAQVKFIKADAPANRAVPATAAAPAAAPAPAKAPKTASQPASSKPAVASQPAKEKTAQVPFNKDDFKNDPLIQKALEVFKGQIVEVRA
jgi:hypothetical protein